MRAVLIFLAAIVLIVLGLWATLVLYFDEARLKQIAIDQVYAQTGRTLQIDGPLELDFLPGVSLLARDVQLSGPENYTGPELFSAEQFRMSLKLMPLLRGEVETGDISLDNARLTVHTDASGRSSLDGLAGGDTEPAAPSAGAAPKVRTGQVRLSGSRVTLSDATTDAREVFIVERLQISSFAFDRPVPFEFEGGIGEPPLVDKIDVEGTLNVPSAGGAIRVTELGMTAEAAGLPIGLSGTAMLDPGPPLVARFEDGVLNLNGKTYQASLSFRDAPQRPRVDATLIGEYLNADALLAVMPGGDEAVVEEDAESPLLLLKEFDVDANLELGVLILSGLEMTEVRARLRSDNGVVHIDPLSGQLAGGRVDAVAMADLNAEPPLIQIDPLFDLQSLGDALAPWGVQKYLTGAGILELAVSTRGLDAQSMLSTLNGSGQYTFRDGAVNGLNLDGMVEALAAGNLTQAVTAGVGGSTPFQEFAGDIRITDGTVTLPGMELVTRLLGVTGNVELGLGDLSLDGQLRLSGERLNQIPLGLGGTLSSPRLTPDVGEALKEEAGQRVMDFLKKRTEKDDGDGGR